MTDICILGGGLVGGVAALALANQGLHVTVVDAGDKAYMVNPYADGRTTAINLASKKIFEELGLWNLLASHAEPILDIKVYEINSPWSLHFDHKMVGRDPMGFIVENRIIRQSIFNLVLEHPLITWREQTTVISKKLEPSGVILSFNQGEDLKTLLMVGAEGRHSPSRDEAGIKKYHFGYDQQALVFSVYHDHPHQGVAWEAFHPQGPLAFLPLQDCPKTSRPRSGVVWTLSTKEASLWLTRENHEIASHLYDLFSFLGHFEVVGEKWHYPLSAQMVTQCIDKRFVIIGDAAHVYHPVAGQGVNVGWRDAAQLALHLQQAQQLGMDLGSQQILKKYQRQRQIDTWSVFAMTDGLVRLFSNQSLPLYFLRNAGIGAINQIPPLKRFFMRRAMGFV